MPNVLALAAPFALFLPLLGQVSALVQTPGEARTDKGGSAVTSSAPDYDLPPEGPLSPARPAVSPLDAFHGSQTVRQVRIEQRVIIRITPQRQSNRNNLLAQLPQRELSTRYEEREIARCLPVSGISGVQTGDGNRLLLFLRDQRVITVNLERACRAREFYSGFYIERNEDGQFCVDRDELQSRSGAKCEVERMRQLVAVDD